MLPLSPVFSGILRSENKIGDTGGRFFCITAKPVVYVLFLLLILVRRKREPQSNKFKNKEIKIKQILRALLKVIQKNRPPVSPN